MSALDKYPKRERNPDGTERNYGFFGYDSAITDIIIRNDDAEAMEEMVAQGRLKKNSPVFGFSGTFADFCESKGAVNCAAYLRG